MAEIFRIFLNLLAWRIDVLDEVLLVDDGYCAVRPLVIHAPKGSRAQEHCGKMNEPEQKQDPSGDGFQFVTAKVGVKFDLDRVVVDNPPNDEGASDEVEDGRGGVGNYLDDLVQFFYFF